MSRIIFAADHPLVMSGTYDREGFTPRERRAQARAQRGCSHKFIDSTHCLKCGWQPPPRKKETMRFFDDDKVGCYLDDIGHRVEKTKDGKEHKVVDLTLRVQPFTPELAVSLDPDVRALLFSMSDATPKPKLKACHFALQIPRQRLTIGTLPETADQIVFDDCEVGDVRARTEKGVDGFGLVFYVAYGPASPRDLEYVCDWLTQQRFVTFQPQQPALDFAGKPAGDGDAPAPPRRPGRPRREQPTPESEPIRAGDELREGVVAEH